ncbi:hypothetical protein PoB_002507800 [Plakobranchus ocellatus]|uniref:Uncharacterized protein n=1 Tax=Plakobranchus ocellatus TaxID=259542 RepID=A0AAV3ZVV3_9GAST|nr:hypothetical protein PoB_002507800 [Plakobranchus ocellatus]
MQSFTGQHLTSATVMILMMSVFFTLASTAFIHRDVSKISSSTSGPGTVLLSTLANQTYLRQPENDQSTQWKIMPYDGRRFLEKLRTSRKFMNLSSSATNKEDSNKNNTSHIFEKEVIFESKKCLNLDHYENQTQEQITGIFKNNNNSKILSEVIVPKTIKEELKEVLNTTDLFKFCPVPCLNYPLWIFNASLIRPNSEKKVDNSVEISDNSKNETNSNDTEILTYNEEDSSNKSYPKVETEYNESETPSLPEYSLNRSSFNASEVIPFPKLEFDVEIDAALTFTCQDRCGVTTLLPMFVQRRLFYLRQLL